MSREKLSRETLLYEDCEDCQKKVAPKLLDVNMQCLFSFLGLSWHLDRHKTFCVTVLQAC